MNHAVETRMVQAGGRNVESVGAIVSGEQLRLAGVGEFFCPPTCGSA
jgi:hypothetical protein